MHPRTFLFPLSLVLISSAAAQEPKPAPTLRPPADALTLRSPVHSTDESGALHTAGGNYVARFDGNGASFVPFVGSDAEQEWPVTFALASVRVGARELAVADAMPRREGEVVAFDRGAVIEQYVTGMRGIEQRFLFTDLPMRGELRLAVAFTTTLLATMAGDGVHFDGPRGGVHYGHAVAIDGNGRRVTMATELHDGRLELVVPAAFVATATLPLLVDPLIGALAQFNNDSVPLGNLDAAWNQQTDEWYVVFDYAFNANNYHVFGQRLTAAGLPVGAVAAIDNSATSWYRPRIASLASPHRFLVVAECDDVASSPWVAGRTVTVANGTVTLGVPFTIAKSGLNGVPIGTFGSPDVGGDGSTAAGGTFVVAYEYGTAPDRDVHLRRIGSDGSLLGSHTLVAATAYDERAPRISKSNGFGNATTQRWGLLYERRVGTGAGDAAKVWGALVNRDGTLRSLLGANTWVVFDAAVTGRGGHDISSPTDDVNGARWLLAVESRPTASQGQNLFGVAFSDQGVGGAPVDVSLLEGYAAATVARNQHSPVVDSDGTRFAVVYSLDYSATDRDVYAVTLAPNGGALAVHDAAPITTSTDDEVQPMLVGKRSGGGNAGEYLLACKRVVGTDHRLLAAVYQGLAPGGLNYRATGCGGLGLVAYGNGALATPVTVLLNSVQGVSGFLAGAPLSAPLGPCPGCTVGTTMDVVVAGASWTFSIPNSLPLVGITVAVQGFDFAPSGPCFGQIRASSTIDVTVR